MKVAVINCGSSSIKYEVFSHEGLDLLATGIIEKIGDNESRLKQRRRRADGTFEEQSRTKRLADHSEAFHFMADINREHRIIEDDSELLGIGHRVVHGGERFHKATLINDEVVEGIRSLIPLAPLHNPSNLLGIEAARGRFPGVPQVAVFDTGFHQTLPSQAFHYAVPYEWYDKYHVRRYGFHGTSHSYVSKEATYYLRKPAEDVNMITLHLGNGASCAAIRGGISVDTSMGMTPLEGLVMGTRSGDIDPAVHFYLMKEAGMTADDLERSLNSQSGLKGVCGTNDMREVEQQAERGSRQAGLALDIFCYRIRKYIGAYYAVLGRVDAIVFTGGIGENSALVRSRVCDDMKHLGIRLDEGRNQAAAGNISEVQADGAPAKILVVKTDEEKEIARQTLKTVRSKEFKDSEG